MFANAGHLPQVLAIPGGECRIVDGNEDTPLGVGHGKAVWCILSAGT